MNIYCTTSLNSSYSKKYFRQNVVEKIKAHFMFNDVFVRESYRLSYNAGKKDTVVQATCQYNTEHALYMVEN